MKSSSSEPYPIADTARQIQPFHVMKILGEAKALEAQGRDIIHMEIGEPDFSSLPQVHDAVQQAMNAGQTHYTPHSAYRSCAQPIGLLPNFYGAEVPSERICSPRVHPAGYNCC